MRYLGTEERMAWACAVGLALILGWVAGRVVPRWNEPPAKKPYLRLYCTCSPDGQASAFCEPAEKPVEPGPGSTL